MSNPHLVLRNSTFVLVTAITYITSTVVEDTCKFVTRYLLISIQVADKAGKYRWKCVVPSPDRVEASDSDFGPLSNMTRAQQWCLAAILCMCSLQTHLVAAQPGSAPSPSSTLQDVSHFDPSKYALPVPSKNAAASSEAGNQTASLAAIADTIATAAAVSPSEQPKYILPVPSQVPAPEGARAESAVAAPSTALSASSAAKIESVSGFVQRQGQNFVLNGKTVYFAGTNAW